MNEEDCAKMRLAHGMRFPYDGSDKFWEGSEEPDLTGDWSHNAARGVLADLQDRRTINRGFEDIDEEIRVEIVNSLASIIALAAEQAEKGDG